MRALPTPAARWGEFLCSWQSVRKSTISTMLTCLTVAAWHAFECTFRLRRCTNSSVIPCRLVIAGWSRLIYGERVDKCRNIECATLKKRVSLSCMCKCSSLHHVPAFLRPSSPTGKPTKGASVPKIYSRKVGRGISYFQLYNDWLHIGAV